jgi:hypothetical protein
MKTLDLILICHWASIVSGLLGACIWFKESTARVTEQDDRYYVGGDMRGTYKGQPIWVVSTAMKQSVLNKYAAIFTGVAVLSQVLVLLSCNEKTSPMEGISPLTASLQSLTF